PAQLLYGCDIILPHQWTPPAEQDDLEEAIMERVKATEKEIPEIRNLAQANSVKAKSIEKESYDRTVTVYNFNVGDSVLLSVEGIRSKFEPAWTGPYKVTEQLQRGNYIIKDSRNNFDVVNGDRLKKFISGNRRVPEDDKDMKQLLGSYPYQYINSKTP
ncbi:hypothetical protein BB560_006393, partial [Smittium megazygosporum]